MADHERAWCQHQVVTDPVHRAAATALRRDYRALTAAPRPVEVEVQARSLSDYDTLLGITDEDCLTDGGPAMTVQRDEHGLPQIRPRRSAASGEGGVA